MPKRKILCECPICEAEIDLGRSEEGEMLECPDCGSMLEVVSLMPPVLEESPEEEEEEEEWEGE